MVYVLYCVSVLYGQLSHAKMNVYVTGYGALPMHCMFHAYKPHKQEGRERR